MYSGITERCRGCRCFLTRDIKCAYFFAGIYFYRVICDKIATVSKTSNAGTRHQPQIKREQAWHLLKKLDIFTLAGPSGLDPWTTKT